MISNDKENATNKNNYSSSGMGQLPSSSLSSLREDPETSFNRIQMAMLGSPYVPEAQYQLARHYELGSIPAQNPDDAKQKAKQCYRSAAVAGHQNALHHLLYNNDLPEVRECKIIAAQGNSEAQLRLGGIYMEGSMGVGKNPEKAVEQFKSAAVQNLQEALFNLAVCYEEGRGIPQDIEMAITLYQSLAIQGHASARCNLGLCYENGQGVEKNIEMAVKLYRLAAIQGNIQAQSILGVCYENGQGVDKDVKEAVRRYRIAAFQGSAAAQYNLGLCYENGTGVAKNLKRAMELYKLAADQGLAEATDILKTLKESKLEDRTYQTKDLGNDLLELRKLFQLGFVHLGKIPLSKEDITQGMEQVILAAEQSLPEAQCYLGMAYISGFGFEKNLARGIELFTAAAKQGLPEAQFHLGMAYVNGYGVEKSPERAVQLFRAVAAGKSDICTKAQFYLGLAYLTGYGGEKDPLRGGKLLESAGQKHYTEAYPILAYFYTYVQPNEVKQKIYQEFADQNSHSSSFISSQLSSSSSSSSSSLSFNLPSSSSSSSSSSLSFNLPSSSSSSSSSSLSFNLPSSSSSSSSSSLSFNLPSSSSSSSSSSLPFGLPSSSLSSSSSLSFDDLLARSESDFVEEDRCKKLQSDTLILIQKANSGKQLSIPIPQQLRKIWSSLCIYSETALKLPHNIPNCVGLKKVWESLSDLQKSLKESSVSSSEIGSDLKDALNFLNTNKNSIDCFLKVFDRITKENKQHSDSSSSNKRKTPSVNLLSMSTDVATSRDSISSRTYSSQNRTSVQKKKKQPARTRSEIDFFKQPTDSGSAQLQRGESGNQSKQVLDPTLP